ncbi:hypothetical protein G7Z17_g10660 [Cylindrodendrum hubeiense]|uniref:Uncharacterized protein n=1 Tax=Cylindrodendrum hubeiense TaxID=595255 RepID=A0A9P5LB09_9HYPO|nr:hypothetical protein G7Z17_g10660 [Cylindrodendrum hubeiense]
MTSSSASPSSPHHSPCRPVLDEAASASTQSHEANHEGLDRGPPKRPAASAAPDPSFCISPARTDSRNGLSSIMAAQVLPGSLLPRVTIQFCTQCKWMLRAAYFAQELLSTFGTALGEVALQPSTGGTFIVTITHAAAGSQDDASSLSAKVLWDRRTDGGFPETKELKRRVRDVIEPGRDLGHVDRHHAVAEKVVDGGAKAAESGKDDKQEEDKQETGNKQEKKEKCEDCQ